jgi:hypothetical protein
MVGRFSAIVGPVIWAGVTWIVVRKLAFSPLTGQGVAFLVLLGLMILSWWILRGVSDRKSA